MSTGSPVPDFGEVRRPGLLGQLLRRQPVIVREANLAAALATLPAGSTVERTDSRGNWIAYRTPGGDEVIRFRASEAWLAAEPTPTRNDTIGTEAAVQADETVVVYEGLHRTRATARRRILLEERLGAIALAPGWLDFVLVKERPPNTESTRAISRLFGGDSDAPPVPAR